MPLRASASKVRRHREALRRKGLRPIQLWVPDTRDPDFAKEAHRQALAVSDSLHEVSDQGYIDSVSDWV
jgi:Protein  of unknown function (DUF3018)